MQYTNSHVFIFVSASELDHVTCGSVLKLVNTRSDVRLHSHDVKYGSGSGQQVNIITAVSIPNWLLLADIYSKSVPIQMTNILYGHC